MLDFRKSCEWQIVQADIDDGPDNEVGHLRLASDVGLSGQLDQLVETLVVDVGT